MREDEVKDLARAAAGDAAAMMRIERRREIRKMVAENRRQRLMDATPCWADQKAIKAIYEQARQVTLETGVKHEVDHVLPIAGNKVCGLHVPSNLRVIPKAENARKHCSHGDDDVVGFLAKKGYEVRSGVRKLNREIRVGKAVVVLDWPESWYRIFSDHGELVMQEIADGELGSAVLISKKV